MEDNNAIRSDKCERCGASLRAYFHTLTPGLVRVLIKIITAVHKKGKNSVHLQRDMELTKTEYANAQKLRFHGLIAHADPNNKNSGLWLVSAKGGAFLRGEISVPKRVKTFRNKVMGHSDEVIHIGELKSKIPYFESQFVYETLNLGSFRKARAQQLVSQKLL